MNYIHFLCGLFCSLFINHAFSEENHNAFMTIFVHGTVKPVEFSFESLMHIIRDEIDNTLYSQAVKYIRNDPLFYQGQAMQEIGLRRIDRSSKNPHTTAKMITKLYDLQHKHLHSKPEHILYYTYGWSGLLSDTKRYEDAEKFYQQLQVELEHLLD